MGNTENKAIKEICDDLLLEVGRTKLNKLDLLYRSIYQGYEVGFLDEEERNALFQHLKKVASHCGIGLGIPRLK